MCQPHSILHLLKTLQLLMLLLRHYVLENALIVFLTLTMINVVLYVKARIVVLVSTKKPRLNYLMLW